MIDNTFRFDHNGGMSVRRAIGFINGPTAATPFMPFRAKYQHDGGDACVLIQHWTDVPAFEPYDGFFTRHVFYATSKRFGP